MIALALAAAAALQVGSKKFTESVILGEIAVQTLRDAGIAAEHRRELGGTRVLWDALRGGQIDVYPEYTGTIAEELLGGRARAGAGASADGDPDRAARSGSRTPTPSGCAAPTPRGSASARSPRWPAAPGCSSGFTNEFMRRRDGWPRLREVYGFSDAHVRGMEHELAYRALRAGEIDATDLYSTDAEIQAGDLVVLEDDRGAFPRYDAVLL